MSRTFFSTAVLIALAVAPSSLRADEPVPTVPPSTLGKSGTNIYTGGTTISAGTLTLGNNAASTTFSGVISNETPAPPPTLNGSGTLTLQGANAYSGPTTLTVGALNMGSWSADAGSGQATLTVNNALSLGGEVTGELDYSLGGTGFFGGAPSVSAPRSPITPIPRGPVFYIVVEGAGLGDSVRTVPCTGGETVMSAVGAVGGISQVSSTKIWIARPSPNSADKGAVLPVDWEAISKRGVNKTNYKLMPGDRLVFGEDPATTKTNLLSKKTAPIERVGGIVGLTTSTFKAIQNTPGGGKLVKDLIERNLITDDEKLKTFILDAVRDGEQNKKTAPKAKDGAKAGEEKGKPATATLMFDDARSADIFDDAKPAEKKGKPATASGTGVLELQFEQPKKPKTGGQAKQHEITLRGTIVLDVSPPTRLEKAAAHELAMQPMPAYRIEPPDVISIELRKPAPPARNAGKQGVTGQYLVGPDGTINLREYGSVPLFGKTVAEARTAIESQLKKHFDAPEVSVDVAAFNSKTYYVITQGAGLGDSVRRLPITGNETVLDAIGQVGGLSQLSSGKKIRIVRPSASDPKKAAILQVDWDGISRRGETATNYQILPRDRVYIGDDATLAATNLLSKKTAPIERAMGVISLTTSVVQSINAAPGGAAAVKELVRTGTFDDDPQLKRIVEDTLRICDEESKKAAAKPAGASKPAP